MAGQKARLTKELRMLETDPPPGVSAWPKGDAMTELEAGARARSRTAPASTSHPPARAARTRARRGPAQLPHARARARTRPVVIEGPEGSPYEGGHFRLDLVLSARYPFEPPKVRRSRRDCNLARPEPNLHARGSARAVGRGARARRPRALAPRRRGPSRITAACAVGRARALGARARACMRAAAARLLNGVRAGARARARR